MKPKVEIVNHAINQGLLDELIHAYSNSPIYDRKNKDVWEKGIVGYSSDVLVNDLNSYERNRLLSYVSKLYPKVLDYENVSAMFYRWTPNSYIPPHNDGNAKVSITIYLNQMYDPKEGGYFLYKPQGDTKEERASFSDGITGVYSGASGKKDKRHAPDWICIHPTYNRLVYIEGTVEHTVTPVTSLRNRLSLQIFCV